MENGYAEPLLDILNDIEPEDHALNILGKMIRKSRISDVLREPTESDKAVVTAHLHPDSFGRSDKYGQKHVCVSCERKYYDMNGRVTQCPQCKTPMFKAPK